MRRFYWLFCFLCMTVGFSLITSSLFMSSTVALAYSEDFDVYFNKVYVNGMEVPSLIKSSNVIDFSTDFSYLGEEYILDYEIKNGSKNYDSSLNVVCTGGNDYLSIQNEIDIFNDLKALDTRTGHLSIKMIKSYIGDDLEVKIKCEIHANALEREELVEEVFYEDLNDEEETENVIDLNDIKFVNRRDIFANKSVNWSREKFNNLMIEVNNV